MFMGPLDVTKPWDDKGVKGVFGFLGRAFRFFSNQENVISEGAEDPEILKGLHQTIKKVEGDIETLHFNTGISAMMIFLNLVSKKGKVTRDTALTFTKIVAPYAPHMAEELWQLLGKNETLAYEPWPLFEEIYLVEDTFQCPVSVNGKMRFKIELPMNLPADEVKAIILSDERINKWVGEGNPKVIIVPNRIVNIVV
jgi:leucyl-tRNA synthetase